MDFELKKWKPDYASGIVKYAGNPKIAQNLTDGFPKNFDLETARSFVEACVRQEGKNQCSRAIVIGEEAVGNLAVFFGEENYRRSGKIAYWLGEPFWRQGIMSSAISQFSRYIFQNYDIVRISAEPFDYNTGSQKALEKAGYKLEGILKKSVYKDNRIFDSCLYALTKDDC